MTAPEQDRTEWLRALADTPECQRECYEHDWRPDHRRGILVCPVCGATQEP